ncbi:hypothetical protein PVL29_014736 [Vitis rotundifolia]|uniref:Uncharacterized protein n=1 Tax=Vitis rotundifolia TaxID=103349 RepID=A0AA38ZHK6_VITRO|nr:hypothetical protein PVL29_014736 [Vitis rotundifolia]
MQPQPFTKPTQLIHAVAPPSHALTKPIQLTYIATLHHNSLTQPTQLTHAAHGLLMHTSPSHAHPHVARTPYSSPMASTAHPKITPMQPAPPPCTHGLLTTTMHQWPPLRPPYGHSFSFHGHHMAILRFLWPPKLTHVPFCQCS